MIPLVKAPFVQNTIVVSTVTVSVDEELVGVVEEIDDLSGTVDDVDELIGVIVDCG